MELRQLEALLAVIHQGSFTRAAEMLNLTQPSLSARIQQLEQSLGCELIRRDKRPIQLTPQGELFADYAERALGILNAGRDALMPWGISPGSRYPSPHNTRRLVHL